MQFLYAIVAFATLAASSPAPDLVEITKPSVVDPPVVDPDQTIVPRVTAAQSPCGKPEYMVWSAEQTKGGGGWGVRLALLDMSLVNGSC